MHRWISLVERIRPFSFAALLLVVVCLAAATLLRLGFGLIGVNVPFGTYYPAVLIAALIAGWPAGAGIIIGAVIIAWWAFIPPLFEFSPLTRTQVANFGLFVFSSGCVVGLAQWHRDVVRRLRRHDYERDLLVQELQHRGRNTYAVVESIVRNTLVNDRASADAIAGRVRAVSSANDLVNQSNTKTVGLRALLTLEFAPNAEERLLMSGPDVIVSSDAARKLGLVFHELTTNAMKHGALAKPDGRVSVSCEANGDKISLGWKEEGGPPVLPPARQGFGTVIVTQSIKSLGGDIVFAFEPSGLQCTMHFACR
ncbi:MAG TPA: HWE histidine kinase domain-containing protein [Xanthobacteraceae bacterium]|jgi:two-component sensor histidine kinase|nr:HWE histidine kinase domain-containing protein [Xanthobacteraceae bacterium]